MDKLKFSKTILRDINPGDTEQRFGDTEQPGLIFRVMPSGHRSFHLQRKINGRTTRISIGPFPEMTVEQARVKAREYINKVISGEEIQDTTPTITMNDLFAAFTANFQIRINAGERREHSLTGIERNYRLHIKPLLGTHRIRDINSRLAINSMNTLKQKTPSIYNKGLTICKAMFNYAAENELITENPFAKLQKLAEKTRERILKPEEMTQFFESVMLEPQIYRDAVMVTLFTGQRKACVLSMEWAEIDLTNRLWHIPISKMKGKRAHTVPLINEVADILIRRKREAAAGERFVFPSPKSQTGHIAEKTGKGGFWRRITVRAGLYSENKNENLCVHDLRRTLGSWQAMGGESLLVISKVLGHKDIKVTANVYAHLQMSGAREGIESAASAMRKAGDSAAEGDKLAGLVADLSEEERSRLLRLLSGGQA